MEKQIEKPMKKQIEKRSQKQNEKQKGKIVEYDIARVIAIILVIIGHCTYCRMITGYGGINYSVRGLESNTINIIGRIINIIYLFHMPLFMAISGALFNKSIQNGSVTSIKELAIKKAKRLLIPFILLTLLFSTPIKYITGYFSYSENVLKDIFVGQVLIQGNTYLWFLPTLFLEFIIVYYIESKEKLRNKKILWIVIFSLLSIHSNLSIIVIGRSVSCNLIYFYAGYLFEQHRKEVNKYIDSKSKFNITGQVIIGLMLLIIFNIMCNLLYQCIYTRWIYGILKLMMGFVGSYMVYLISYKLSKTKLKESKVIEKLNENSFGLYLYSDPLNYAVLFVAYNIINIHLFFTSQGVVMLYLVRFIITFGVAYLITNILRKAKVKYIC